MWCTTLPDNLLARRSARQPTRGANRFHERSQARHNVFTA
jgi:hypothetical protein